MKKALVVLLIVFALFWMVTDPRGLALSARKTGGHAGAIAGAFFTSVITFVRDLE
jgi:hypothetical protein